MIHQHAVSGHLSVGVRSGRTAVMLLHERPDRAQVFYDVVNDNVERYSQTSAHFRPDLDSSAAAIRTDDRKWDTPAGKAKTP